MIHGTLNVDPLLRISYDKFFSKAFLTACPTDVHTVLIHFYVFVRTAVNFVICFAWPQQKTPICILKRTDKYAISATEQTSAIMYLPITENVF